jgi:hypothetical protein
MLKKNEIFTRTQSIHNNKQFCIKKVVIPENKSSNQSNTHHENPNQSLIKTDNYILPFME